MRWRSRGRRRRRARIRRSRGRRRNDRRPREGGDPAPLFRAWGKQSHWVPAFAETTRFEMENLLSNYGWWLLALVLIAAEMIAPGYFMLWIGIAAGVMGVVTFLAPAMSALVQAIVFALLAIASCTIYWR